MVYGRGRGVVRGKAEGVSCPHWGAVWGDSNASFEILARNRVVF